MEQNVLEQMRADWNRRAREDVNYFVAFARRCQSDDEFFATGAPVLWALEKELKWILPRLRGRAPRALEIGCGPGRLMRLMARYFDEIWGVDVSDEMIRLAREKLCDVANARVERNNGTDLAGFTDHSFDFVYSYAVFQHIPSREVVMGYLEEAWRVLRPGGLMRCQLNGMPESGPRCDTWHGVRIPARDIVEFARARDCRLLALEGALTQYMWVTIRKPGPPPSPAPLAPVYIRQVTNPYTSEPVVPYRGRFASMSLWAEGLPLDCDLLTLEVHAGGRAGEVFYVGPPDIRSLQQINVRLPEGLTTGIQPLSLRWRGRLLCPESLVRLIPPGPAVPRLISVTDSIDLLAGSRISSGHVKVTLEEAQRPEDLVAIIDGHRIEELEVTCTDPVPPRHEINFALPPSVASGGHLLELSLGRRRFPPVGIEVVVQTG